MRRVGTLTGLVGAALAGAALVVGTGSGPPAAKAAGGGCTRVPAVYPESQVAPGLAATGKTVLRGTTPTAFGAKVIGVLKDGVAPGIDMYVVKLSGSVVRQAGGAFYGISGSPVYVHGKLLGSVSYLLTGDFTVAGLTPAQPIVNLFTYPRGSAAATGPAVARHVALTPALRRAVAAVTKPGAAGGSSMSLLRTPVAVSGLPDAGLHRLQGVFDRYGLAFTAVRGSSAAAPTGVEGSPIVAGGNFAVTQSYGDLTFYGVGTATAVCGDEVVAFGHPFNLTGPASYGMNTAETVAVLKDPFGGVKIANITGFAGMIDQDRLTGVRGITGVMPALTNVATTIRNADLGTSRDGTTAVADQTFMPLIAQNAVYAENLVTYDRFGSGSETMGWRIDGTYQGEPFTLTRTGVAVSQYDINYDSSYELTGELGALVGSKFGPAQIARVRFTGTITQAQKTARIGPVESASSRQPTFAVRRRLSVRPGDTVRLHVTLRHADGSSSIAAMSIKLPAAFKGGTLELRGGTPPEGCAYCSLGDTFRTTAKSFAQMLAQFQNGEHANDLIAGVGKTRVSAAQTDQILGQKAIDLIVRGRRPRSPPSARPTPDGPTGSEPAPGVRSRPQTWRRI